MKTNLLLAPVVLLLQGEWLPSIQLKKSWLRRLRPPREAKRRESFNYSTKGSDNSKLRPPKSVWLQRGRG